MSLRWVEFYSPEKRLRHFRFPGGKNNTRKKQHLNLSNTYSSLIAAKAITELKNDSTNDNV